MQAFCTAFAKVSPTVPAIKTFIDTHSISGVSVDPSNPLTVVYQLTRPATYFPNQLAMPAFSPAPVEFLNYLPASNQLAQHTISDGPYMVQSYVPAKSIDFVRNPVWNASNDPVRKAYVDKINVSETGNQQGIQQQLETNSASRRHGLGHRGADGGHSRPAGQQEPQPDPRGHLRHQPVHRLQRGVAQQRRRPWPTSRCARPSSTASTATI